MKKYICVLVFALSAISVAAFPQMGVAADLGTAYDIVRKQSCQLNADFRVDLSDDFEFRLPVTYTVSTDGRMVDAGAFICFHPFHEGLYFGISAVQFGYHSGSFIAMNEITAGWTFSLFKRFFVEPELCIRDPSGTYSDEYSALRGLFPSYSTFRIRLKVGLKINTLRSERNESEISN